MSWLEKINQDFTITTGEGSEWKVLWRRTGRDTEYNIAQWDFSNLSGSLVVRGKPKGRQFPIEIVFQGENHLDTAAAFDKAAADPRAWTIAHPLYGTLKVQPLSLSFDDTMVNVTTVRGMVVETIIEDAPKTSIAPSDKILAIKSITDSQLSTSFATEVPQPRTVVVQKMRTNILATYNQGVKKLSTSLDAEAYYNSFNNANTFINNISTGLAAPLDALQSVGTFLSAPVSFAEGVESRISLFVSQLAALRANLTNILERPFKKLFEHNSGTLISSMAASTVTNASYSNRKAALSVAQSLGNAYSQYIIDLDTLQNANGGNPANYVADPYAIRSLDQLVNLAISNLFSIADGSKQERITYLEEDSNIITAAYEYWGLKPDDSTLDEFIAVNEITLDEMLQLRKGRRIIYYV